MEAIYICKEKESEGNTVRRTIEYFVGNFQFVTKSFKDLICQSLIFNINLISISKESETETQVLKLIDIIK